MHETSCTIFKERTVIENANKVDRAGLFSTSATLSSTFGASWIWSALLSASIMATAELLALPGSAGSSFATHVISLALAYCDSIRGANFVAKTWCQLAGILRTNQEVNSTIRSTRMALWFGTSSGHKSLVVGSFHSSSLLTAWWEKISISQKGHQYKGRDNPSYKNYLMKKQLSKRRRTRR